MRGDNSRLREVFPEPEQLAVPAPRRLIPAEERRAAADEVVHEEDEGESGVRVAERITKVLEHVVPLRADDSWRGEDLFIADHPRVRAAKDVDSRPLAQLDEERLAEQPPVVRGR